MFARPVAYDSDVATTLNGLVLNKVIGTTVGDAVFVFTGGAIEDEWTDASHGLSDGDKVIFYAVGTGAPEFLINTPYYVANKNTNIYNLSLTSGGAAIAGTADSIGTWSVALYNEGNVNQAVYFDILTGNVATGDSDIDYRITYRIITSL